MATYYIDGAVGNDSNAGTSEGAGNAWATLSKISTLSSGDICYVKASATYTSETIITGAAGTSSSPIRIIGYSSTPGDGGQFEMDGNSGTTTYGVLNASSYLYWRFENIYMHDFASYGIYGPNADSAGFVNIKIDNCGWGVYYDNYNTFINCEVLNCSNRGIMVDGNTTLVNCRFIDNGGTSYNTWLRDNQSSVIGCVFSSDAGVLCYTNGYGLFLNNVFDGQSTVNGLHISAAYYEGGLINNIFYNCSTAIDDTGSASAYYQAKLTHLNNMFYGNTSNYTGTGIPSFLKATDITGTDPGFNAPGTYDYTIDSDSGAFEVGYPAYAHVGSSWPQCSAGGGTPRVILTT